MRRWTLDLIYAGDPNDPVLHRFLVIALPRLHYLTADPLESVNNDLCLLLIARRIRRDLRVFDDTEHGQEAHHRVGIMALTFVVVMTSGALRAKT